MRWGDFRRSDNVEDRGAGGPSGGGLAGGGIKLTGGALVIVVATMPFSFEGRRRLGQAEEALELLREFGFPFRTN